MEDKPTTVGLRLRALTSTGIANLETEQEGMLEEMQDIVAQVVNGERIVTCGGPLACSGNTDVGSRSAGSLLRFFVLPDPLAFSSRGSRSSRRRPCGRGSSAVPYYSPPSLGRLR
jgi:hypothetical protein